jgi:hypothetical protein
MMGENTGWRGGVQHERLTGERTDESHRPRLSLHLARARFAVLRVAAGGRGDEGAAADRGAFSLHVRHGCD